MSLSRQPWHSIKVHSCFSSIEQFGSYISLIFSSTRATWFLACMPPKPSRSYNWSLWGDGNIEKWRLLFNSSKINYILFWSFAEIFSQSRISSSFHFTAGYLDQIQTEMRKKLHHVVQWLSVHDELVPVQLLPLTWRLPTYLHTQTKIRSIFSDHPLQS